MKNQPKRVSHKRKGARKVTGLAINGPAVLAKPEPWVLRPEQVALLKRTVAKGTSDDEFALFLWVAKKHKLDPMTRQLHCVKRWSSALNQEMMAIQIGIDGYRSMAARYPDYGGVDEPEYEYDLSKKGPDNPAGLVLARVRVWKKGFDHPTIGIAFWDEYRPDLSKPQSFMWKKMPKGQLAKCAEALALRKAYPDLADIYTDEEMHQADDTRAPSGRELISPGDTGSVEAAQAVAQVKLKELQERAAAKAIEKPVAEAAKVCPAAPVAQVSTQSTTAAKSSKPPSTQQQTKTDDTQDQTLLCGVIEATKIIQTTAGRDYLKARIAGREFSCFDKKRMGDEDLWSILAQNVGEQAEVVVLAKAGKDGRFYQNIIGVRRVGLREWDDEGLPVIQRRGDIEQKDIPF